MRIAMIGVGYVGLVSGACFADFGHRVSCIDKDVDRIAALKRGDIPIFEPGLNQLVATNAAAGTRSRQRASRSARTVSRLIANSRSPQLYSKPMAHSPPRRAAWLKPARLTLLRHRRPR